MSVVSEKSIPEGIVAEIGATVPVKVGKTTFTGKVVSSGWGPTVQVKLWLLHMHLTGSKTEMDLKVDADAVLQIQVHNSPDSDPKHTSSSTPAATPDYNPKNQLDHLLSQSPWGEPYVDAKCTFDILQRKHGPPKIF